MLPDALHVQTFKKKPVSIAAAQFTGHNSKAIVKWIREAGGTAKAGGRYIDVVTLEGVMRVTRGMMVIQGVHGEFYPCRLDIFKETYQIHDRHVLN